MLNSAHYTEVEKLKDPPQSTEQQEAALTFNIPRSTPSDHNMYQSPPHLFKW